MEGGQTNEVMSLGVLGALYRASVNGSVVLTQWSALNVTAGVRAGC